MSAKKHKEIRKQVKALRRDEKEVRSVFLMNTLASPLRVRIRIAWLILKGLPK